MEEQPHKGLDLLLPKAIECERCAAAAGECEHSSINRVMLAACCVATPGAFAPLAGEPLVRV